VQYERVSVATELGDDKRHAVGHQPADEVNIPRQPVQLGTDDRAFALTRLPQRCSEHRTALQGIGPLAGFDLLILAD
jgi:hypothetical protein